MSAGVITKRARYLQDLKEGHLIRGLSEADLVWVCREMNRESLNAIWNRELHGPGEWRARLSEASKALLRRRAGEAA